MQAKKYSLVFFSALKTFSSASSLIQGYHKSEVMTEAKMKVMVEVLSIRAIATTEIKRSRRSELTIGDYLLLTDVPGEKYQKRLLAGAPSRMC